MYEYEKAAALALDARLAAIGGCGDGNCMIHVRGGMHTNGGCRCSSDRYKMQRVVNAYKQYRKTFQTTGD